MHYKPPRWTEEYAKMHDRDLYRRIQDDLGELLARAYPTRSRSCRAIIRVFNEAGNVTETHDL